MAKEKAQELEDSIKNSEGEKISSQQVIDEKLQSFITDKEKIFPQIVGIVSATFILGIWIMKFFWYCNQRGRFSVYNIDTCYINANEEGIILQSFQYLSYFIIAAIINIICYSLLTYKDKSKFKHKKILNILCLLIVEMFLALYISTIYVHQNIFEVIKRIPLLSFNKLVELLTLNFLLCIIVNIWAIAYAIEYYIYSKKRMKILVQYKLNKYHISFADNV